MNNHQIRTFQEAWNHFKQELLLKQFYQREQYENGASVRLVFFAEHQAYDQPLNIDHQTK